MIQYSIQMLSTKRIVGKRPTLLPRTPKCFRGHICGHEFVGLIEEKGDNVKALQIGGKVVVPFSTACQECCYCSRSLSGSCTKSQISGMPGSMEGGQAEFVRVPLADTICVKALRGKPAVCETFTYLLILCRYT